MNIPLPEINIAENSSAVDIVTSYLQNNFHDKLTVGELTCLIVYYSDQLENNSSTFNLELYANYLCNNSEYPIKNIQLTARELYEQAPGVHDYIDKMQDLTYNYRKLSKEQKIQFIKNKMPSDSLTTKILDNATGDELYYMSAHGVFNILENIRPYDNKTWNVVGEAYSYKDEVEKVLLRFNTEIQSTDYHIEIDNYPSIVDENNTVNQSISSLTSIENNLIESQNNVGDIGLAILISGVGLTIFACSLLAINNYLLNTGSIPIKKSMMLLSLNSRNTGWLDLLLSSKPPSIGTNPVAMIVDAILIGIAIVLIGIWLIVLAYVTLDNLILRVQKIKRGLCTASNRD
jgi:hypothetical protein